MDAFDQYQIFECLSSVNKTKVSCWNEKDVLNFLQLTNLNLYEKSFQILHVNGQKLIDSFVSYKYEKFLEKTGVQSVLHYQKLLILVYALKDNYDLYLEIKIKYESLHEKNKEKVQKCLYQYLLIERVAVSEKMLQMLEESKGIKKDNNVFNPNSSNIHNFRKNTTRRICVTQAQKTRMSQIIRDMSFQDESSRECIALYTPQQIAYIIQQFNFSTLLSISSIWGIDGFMLTHLFPIYTPKQLELALDCKNSEISSLLWISDALTALKYQIIMAFTENIPSPIQQKTKQFQQKQEESHSQMLSHPLENSSVSNKQMSAIISPSNCSSNSNGIVSNNNISQLNINLPQAKSQKKQSEDTSATTSASNTPARYQQTKITMKNSEDYVVSPGESSDSVFMFMPETMLQKQLNSQEQKKHRISITFKNEQRKISGETDSAANSCMLDSSTECPTKSSQKEQQKWSSQLAEESFGESQILLPQENTEQITQPTTVAAQLETRSAFCESITFEQTIKPDIPSKESKQLSAIMEMNKSADSLSQQENIYSNGQPIESTSKADLQEKYNFQQPQSQSSFQESVLLGDFQPPQIQLQNQSSSQTDPSSSSIIQQAQVSSYQQGLGCKQQKQQQEITPNEFADSVILNDPPNQTVSNITSIITTQNSEISQKQISGFATSTLLEPSSIPQHKKTIPASKEADHSNNLNNSINLQDSEIFTVSNKINVSQATKEAVSQDQFSDSVILTNNQTQSCNQSVYYNKENDQIQFKNTSHELQNVLQLMGAISEPKYENNINMPRQSVIRNIHGDIDFNQSVVLNNQLLFNNGSSNNSGNSQNEFSENPQDQNNGNLKDARQTFSLGATPSTKGKSDQYSMLMSSLSSKTPTLCFNPFDMAPLKKQNLLKIRIKSPDGALSFDQTVTTEGATIGRKPENNINFPKEQTVSSFHAEIFFSEFAFHLRDKGSKLGTYIKIKEIVLVQEMRLQLSISVEIRIIEVNNEQGAIKMELRRNSGSKQYTSSYSYTMVENQTIKLGRDRERCEIEIKEITISNEHAKIIYKNGVFHMIDSDSRNGIWLRMSPKGVVSAPTIITPDFSFRIDLINISVIKQETHPYFHPIK